MADEIDIEDFGGMSPADLARHSMEVAGPSVFARKIYDAPVMGDMNRAVKWLTQIPLEQFPGHVMNFFMEELYDTAPGSPYLIKLSVRSSSPMTRVSPGASSVVVRDLDLVFTTFDNRAEAYRILYAFILDMHQLCAQEARYHYICQEIVNRAKRIAAANPSPPKTESDTEASSLELASVLLEIDAAELARHSIEQLHTLDHPFTVTSSWGIYYCSRQGTVNRFDVQVDLDGLDAEERDQVEAYRKIVKFDVREWKSRHKHIEQTPLLDIDILDMGFWTADGTYEPPDETWRGIHAMEEAEIKADPDLMQSLVRKSMWNVTDWKFVQKHVGADQRPEGSDPLKLEGMWSFQIIAPLFKIKGHCSMDIYAAHPADEHTNAIYWANVNWMLQQDYGKMGNYNIPLTDYVQSHTKATHFVEDEASTLMDHVRAFFTDHVLPQIEKVYDTNGTRKIRYCERSLKLRWARYMKPWKRTWREVYEKAIWYHYKGDIPPDIWQQVVALREDEMTPKELAIRAVGLPGMAKTVHMERVPGEGSVDQKHYQWVSTTDYSVKITLVEMFIRKQIAGSGVEYRIPSYKLFAKTWIETTPSIYDQGDTRVLFYDVPPEKKGDMYSSLYRALNDIEAAHQAGIDAASIGNVVSDIFDRVSKEGNHISFGDPL